MRPRNLLYLLAALTFILWTSQPVQAQSAGDASRKKGACGGLWPVEQGKKWGYIDKAGRLVIPGKFDSAGDFSEGLAAVEVSDKCGYIDKSGEFVIPSRFDLAFPFADGMALVAMLQSDQKDTLATNPYFRLGFIDKSGNMVFQTQGAVTSKDLRFLPKEMAFSEGLACVPQIDKEGFIKKWGYLDKTGKQVIPPQYRAAHLFSEGLAAVVIADKYGYIDRSGKVVISPRFEHAGPFADGVALVDLDVVGDQGGYIDKSGKMVIKAEEFVLAREFSEGLAAAMGKNGKYGFIDKTGKFVIPPQFFRVGDFSGGLAAVAPDRGKWPGDLAYINQRGQMVIKSLSTMPNHPDRVEFDLHYYRFCGGVARVSLGLGETPDDPFGDAEGYINQEGKFIWPKVMPSKKASP